MKRTKPEHAQDQTTGNSYPALQIAAVVTAGLMSACCGSQTRVKVGEYVWVADGAAASLADIQSPLVEPSVALSAGPNCPATLDLGANLDAVDRGLRKKGELERADELRESSDGWLNSITEPRGELRIYTTNEVKIGVKASYQGGPVSVKASSQTTDSRASLLIVHYRRRADVSSTAQSCLRKSILEQRCKPDSTGSLGFVLSSVLYGGLVRTTTNRLVSQNSANISPGAFLDVELTGNLDLGNGSVGFVGDFIKGKSITFTQLNDWYTSGDAPAVAGAFEEALSAYYLIGFGYHEVKAEECKQ